jgi:hypothetical protein
MAQYYNFNLTLTQEGAASGPYYTVTFRSASIYMPVVDGSPAYLPNVGSTAVMTVPSASYIQFKLANGTGGACEICDTAFTYIATGSAAYTIENCLTSSIKYNVTLYSTQPYDIGNAISGSVFGNGCYFLSASYSGALNFETASVDVFTDCYTCRYGYPPYKWYASQGYATADDACIGQYPQTIVYSNLATIVSTQTYMYTDPALTIPFSPTPFFYSYSRTGVPADGSWTAGLTSYFAPGQVSNTLYCG